MSLVVERFLICDGKDCRVSSGVDAGGNFPNAFILRMTMRKEGWYISPKQDLCPKCAYKAQGE